MRIIGYTYNADCHCVGCTQAYHADGWFDIDTGGPEGDALDEHDIPYGATDSEGNPIHPIFSTSEGSIGEDGNEMDIICGDCLGVIANRG